ncbi:MAG: alpha-D-ribose 1-methylphosphonate 5-triphosphate diphosphatase [Pseudomonadota bacterium]
MPVLTNAKLVLPGEVITGHIAIEDDAIHAIGEGDAAGIDMEGDTLIPGLIELHTDHLEVHVRPRPKVEWNMMAAIQAHDVQIAGSGITTVLDALRIGLGQDGGSTSEDSRRIADAILTAQRGDRLRAEHRLHLRCEVSEPLVRQGFHLFDDVDEVDVVSLMDHSPGQRQFRSLAAYRAYFDPDATDESFEARVAVAQARSAEWASPNRDAIASAARLRGAVVASHDDATEAHVEEALENGVTLAEFPTTEEAAARSRAHGMTVLMGAPNLVRGSSHSGNVSASALADAGALDILSSDYVPFSLIQGAFALSERAGWSLPRAIATVTQTPADAINLCDRGRLMPGKRADIVRVHRKNPGDVPVVREVFRAGRRVV